MKSRLHQTLCDCSTMDRSCNAPLDQHKQFTADDTGDRIETLLGLLRPSSALAGIVISQT